MTSREAVIVIPARFGSVRLPGKPLLRETGKYLVQHAYERACESRRASRVVVATDSEQIEEAMVSVGAEVVMTSPDHQSGTDRVFEAVERIGGSWEVIVNLQGDEPETDPALVDELIESCDENHPMVTAAVPIVEDAVFQNPDQVKVVVSEDGRAVYFSRAPVPFSRESGGGLPAKKGATWLHLGIYAYTRKVLQRFVSLDPSTLEKTERLEQLRALENRIPIYVKVARTEGRGIDTPEDYAEFVARYQERVGHREIG